MPIFHDDVDWWDGPDGIPGRNVGIPVNDAILRDPYPLVQRRDREQFDYTGIPLCPERWTKPASPRRSATGFSCCLTTLRQVF